MENEVLTVDIQKDKIYIGKSPTLVVDLKSQNNFIHYGNKDIPYKKEVRFSADLLQGKRPRVFETAVKYYYQDACEIAKAMQIASEFGKRKKEM